MNSLEGYIRQIIGWENISKIPINTNGLVNTPMTNIIKSLIIFLANYIKKHKDNWISNKELYTILKSYYNNNELYFQLTLSKILYPNIVIENYYLFSHNKGIYKIIQDTKLHSVIELTHEDKVEIKEDDVLQTNNYNNNIDNLSKSCKKLLIEL